ncbi:MAG: hypothetical protein GJ680_07665 [Alteromonadaceae bacterium]|nr:hypothetical protein [Alteromonadaceae bacterium]
MNKLLATPLVIMLNACGFEGVNEVGLQASGKTVLQVKALEYVKGEYPIRSLEGLSYSPELRNDEFFIRGKEHKLGISVCETSDCLEIPIQSICENGFELRAKQLESGLLHAACIPMSVDVAFERASEKDDIKEYCPDMGERPSVFYGPLSVTDNGEYLTHLQCLIPDKANFTELAKSE